MDHHGSSRKDTPSVQRNAPGGGDNNGNAMERNTSSSSSSSKRPQLSCIATETLSLVDSLVEPIGGSIESATHADKMLPDKPQSAQSVSPLSMAGIVSDYSQVADEDCHDAESGLAAGRAVSSHVNNSSSKVATSDDQMDQSLSMSATRGETAASVGNTLLRAVGATFRRRDPSMDESEGADSSEGTVSRSSIWEDGTVMDPYAAQNPSDTLLLRTISNASPTSPSMTHCPPSPSTSSYRSNVPELTHFIGQKHFIGEEARGSKVESDLLQLVQRKSPNRHNTNFQSDGSTVPSTEHVDVVKSETNVLSPMAAAASAVASVIAGVKGGTVEGKDPETVATSSPRAAVEEMERGEGADSNEDLEMTRRTRRDFGASRYDYDINWDMIGRKGTTESRHDRQVDDDDDKEDIPILAHPTSPPDSDSDGLDDLTDDLEEMGQESTTSQQGPSPFTPRRRARSSPTPSRPNVRRPVVGSNRRNLVPGTEQSEIIESVFAGIRQPAPPFALDDRVRDLSRHGRSSVAFDADFDEFFKNTSSNVTPVHEGEDGASAAEAADTRAERCDSLNTEESHSSSATIPTMHRRRRTGSRGSATFASHTTYRSGMTHRSRQRSFSTVEDSASDRHRLSQQTMRRTAYGVADVFGSASDDVAISERSQGSRSLLASLDAGMATLRGWIRSQSRERATTRMGSRSSWAASSSLHLGDEDLFALSYAGNGTMSQFEASSVGGSGSDNRTLFGGSEGGANLASRGPLYPPPIVEEDESHRQRSHSEPDGLGVRDFIFGTSRTGRSPIRPRRNQNRAQPTQPRHRRPRQGSGNRSADGTSNGSDSTGWGGSSFLPSIGSRRPSRGTGLARAHSLSSSAIPSLFQPEFRTSGDADDGPAIELEVFDAASSRASSERTPPLGRGFRDDMPSQVNDEDQLSTVDGNSVAGSEAQANGAARSISSQSTGGGSGASASISSDTTRLARSRWLRINRRFQLTITIVAIVFSLILFAILLSWVILTSAYVIAIEKRCDVPLKMYFWLATFQLVLDVFRSDIMRVIFRWDANSRERMPSRVIVYNIAYLTYAMLVLRSGMKSVFFTEGSTCRETASELFQASTVFVCLSLAAWATIVFGYLVPFCCVAIILSRNGYSPAADITAREGTFGAAGGFVGGGGVFPTAYTPVGAPPGTIDQLRVVLVEEFPDSYPRDCCICMADFVPGEVVVTTECGHVFHKRCCQEWLRQARTCPVCRTDIPNGLNGSGDAIVENADNRVLESSALATVGVNAATANDAESSALSRRDTSTFQQGVTGWLSRLRHVEGSLRSADRTTRANGPVNSSSRITTGGTESTSAVFASASGRRLVAGSSSGTNGRPTPRVSIHSAVEEGRSIGEQS